MGYVKQAYKGEKEATPSSIRDSVMPIIGFLSFTRRLNRLLRLHYSTFELFLCIVYKHYMNGKGCTVSNLMNTLYSAPSATHIRTIHYRLATLVKHELVYSLSVKGINYYFLSDRAKGILEGLNKANKK